MEENKSDTVNESQADYGKYSYADYLTWQFEEVVELIRGKIFKKAAAAPRRIHQKASGELFLRIGSFQRAKNAKSIQLPLMFVSQRALMKTTKSTMWSSRISV